MRRLAGITIVLCTALACAPAAFAAPTYTVSGTTDGVGTCNPSTFQCTTLRAAITAADLPANAGATIKLGAHTYTLNGGANCITTLGELQISQSMTIGGTGQGGSTGTTIRQADNCNRVIEVDPAATATVTLSGLELTGGRSLGSAAEGGGLLADGDGTTQVTLQNVEVTGDAATGESATGTTGESGDSAEGGGIAVETDEGALSTSLTLTDGSVVLSNTATGGTGAGDLAGNGGDGGDAYGAGIDFESDGTLTVSASTVEGNTATAGDAGNGAGSHSGGTGGEGEGGGIHASEGAMVLDSTVSGNRAIGAVGGDDPGGAGGYGGYGYGGGIALDGTAKLTEDTIANNQAVGALNGTGTTENSDGGARGGGLAIDGSSITIDASTLDGNIVTGGGDEGGTGGGVNVDSGYTGLAIVNSTLFDNAAGPDQANPTGGGGGGGGVFTYSPITLASDTVDANQATGAGGAGGNLESGGGNPIRATATIAAGGVGEVGYQNCSGTIEDLAPGHNLEDDAGDQCGFSAGDGDQIGANPQLASELASNGGPTQTLALEAGSPAIGRGGACINPLVTGNPLLPVDQRGSARPAACDVGAFQAEPPVNTALPNIHGKAQPGQTLTCAVGSWSGDGLSFAYAWLANGTVVSGATGSSYKIPGADTGKRLACRVTAGGTVGTAQATSAAVTVQLPAPALTRAGESHHKWRESGKANKHKPPVGTKFSFTLNENASVKLSFALQAKGRKVKRKCVAQSRKNRHHATCKLTEKKGTLTVAGRSGTNTVSFHGNVPHGHRLAPGKYTVTLSASNASGHSRSATLTFTIT